MEDLCVSFATDEGVAQAVDGVSLELDPGEVLAVVASRATPTATWRPATTP